MRIILIVACLFSLSTWAQETTYYWVFLTDKGSEQFDPYEFFNARAIERRVLQGIPVYAENDQPVSTSYKSEVLNLSTAYVGESRWFNAVAVTASPEQKAELETLPFVKAIKEVSSVIATMASYPDVIDMDDEVYRLAARQISIMGGDLFDSLDINGKGVRVAVFDGGFPQVDVHPAFEHVRAANRIKATYNFAKSEEFVYSYNSHGLAVLSNIVGETENAKLGLATNAEVLLARTEIGREIKKEEVYWIMALEWADKLGAQIINSSLGYTVPRYNQQDMNGQTTMISKAANTAASKGILVVNAAGNEGSDYWETIGAPADADSVLAVGGISPTTNTHISFGSYGPSTTGKLKPNVSNYASAIVATKNDYIKEVQGTSFASPLTAGFAACAMQLNPGAKVMDLFHQIEESGHLYPYYDYAVGYGIPQASYFIDQIGVPGDNFNAEITGDTLVIHVTNTLNEHPKAGQHLTNDQLYFHFADANGKLLKYWVREVRSGEQWRFPLGEFAQETKEVRIYLNGDYEVLNR